MQSTYDRIRYYKIGRKRKDRILAKLRKLFADDEQIKRAWLFGSITRRDSVRDIDIAIQTEPKLDFGDYLSLSAQIELNLGVPVDLVEIAKAPETLKERILSSGIKIKG
jgi:predicted nucleotidyltransferase